MRSDRSLEGEREKSGESEGKEKVEKGKEKMEGERGRVRERGKEGPE